jgi:hypothetical protein
MMRELVGYAVRQNGVLELACRRSPTHHSITPTLRLCVTFRVTGLRLDSLLVQGLQTVLDSGSPC